MCARAYSIFLETFPIETSVARKLESTSYRVTPALTVTAWKCKRRGIDNKIQFPNVSMTCRSIIYNMKCIRKCFIFFTKKKHTLIFEDTNARKYKNKKMCKKNKLSYFDVRVYKYMVLPSLRINIRRITLHSILYPLLTTLLKQWHIR